MMPTALDFFVFTMRCVFAVCVIAMVGIGLDYCWCEYRQYIDKKRKAAQNKASVRQMLRQERMRRAKEAAANEGFFEESSVRSFDANGALTYHVVLTPTAKAKEYYREMDRLKDREIFNNTEEL